jgi:hypothetical protein
MSTRAVVLTSSVTGSVAGGYPDAGTGINLHLSAGVLLYYAVLERALAGTMLAGVTVIGTRQ